MVNRRAPGKPSSGPQMNWTVWPLSQAGGDLHEVPGGRVIFGGARKGVDEEGAGALGVGREGGGGAGRVSGVAEEEVDGMLVAAHFGQGGEEAEGEMGDGGAKFVTIGAIPAPDFVEIEERGGWFGAGESGHFEARGSDGARGGEMGDEGEVLGGDPDLGGRESGGGWEPDDGVADGAGADEKAAHYWRSTGTLTSMVRGGKHIRSLQA